MGGWNKGLTKETDARVATNASNISIGMKKYKRTPEHCKNLSLALTGRKLSEENRLAIIRRLIGRKHSKETKRKMSLSRKKLAKEGKLMSADTRKKLSESKLKLIKEGKIKFWIPTQEHREKMRIISSQTIQRVRRQGAKITKPQKILFKYLKKFYSSAELEYFVKVNELKCYFLDVAVPELKLAFEFDGDYWHSFDSHKISDISKDDYLLDSGWSIFRINGEEDLVNFLGIDKYEYSKLYKNI